MKPTGRWTPTSRLISGKGTTSATPAATVAADGSLGTVTPNAGSAAAGSGLGVLSFYGLETVNLDKVNNLQAQVNLANGNLVAHSTDLKINGPGLSLRLDRFYNSRANGAGAFGTNTVLSTGRDAGLQIGSSSVTFTGPSGFTAKFTGSGPSYTAPAGINADLVKNSDGSYSLTYHKTSEKLSFTAGGFLTKDADHNGNALTLAYNADNTLASITDTAGRVTTFAYTAGLISEITDPANRHVTYTYDGNQNLTAVSCGCQAATSYTYDASNRVTRITTPAGNYTDIGYDANNRVSSLTRYPDPNDPASAVSTTFAYPSSTTTTETDPANNTTTYTLDSSGRVTSVKNALGNTKSKTWTANSDIATAVDAMGVSGGAGNTTTFSYDTNNRLTAAAIPTGAAAKAQYATGGGCTSSDGGHTYLPKCTEDSAANRQSSISYDGPGNVTSRSDTTSGGSGRSETYTHQGDSGVPSCGGKPGQVCSATDGNAHKTTYSYDSDGNLTTLTPPAPGSPTTYGYDSLSRLTSVTTAATGQTDYTYDTHDQPTSVTYSDGSGITSQYDADGNVQFYSDNSGSQQYTYDGLDRQTRWLQGNAQADSVTYSPAGDLASYTDASGTVTYGYDAVHELTSLAEPGGSCTAPISACTTFSYNKNGKQTGTTYPGATTQTATVDKSGRATEIKAVHGSTVLSDLRYSYTLAGIDTQLVQTRTDVLGVGAPANSTTSYSYDSLARLTAATEKTSSGSTNASWSYAYDKAGNRTSNTATLSGTTTTTSQGYNAINELTSLNSSTSGLSYDSDGNETANPGHTTIGVQPRTAESNNLREQLASLTAGSASVTFNYDGQDATTRTAVNDTTFDNAMLGLSSQTVGLFGTTTSFIRTPAGTLVAARTNGVSQYLLSDKLGSVVGTVDNTGAKTAAYAYDPYGRTRTATGTNAAANPFRYTGGYYDQATGLTKLGARYYDPNIGRFTQPDPSGKEDNQYAYASNNTANNTDPSGT